MQSNVYPSNFDVVKNICRKFELNLLSRREVTDLQTLISSKINSPFSSISDNKARNGRYYNFKFYMQVANKCTFYYEC